MGGRLDERGGELYYSPDSQEGFRHFYSDIFAVLTQIQSGTKQGSIDILGQNLLEIRKGYQVLNTDIKIEQEISEGITYLLLNLMIKEKHRRYFGDCLRSQIPYSLPRGMSAMPRCKFEISLACCGGGDLGCVRRFP